MPRSSYPARRESTIEVTLTLTLADADDVRSFIEEGAYLGVYNEDDPISEKARLTAEEVVQNIDLPGCEVQVENVIVELSECPTCHREF